MGDHTSINKRKRGEVVVDGGGRMLTVVGDQKKREHEDTILFY